MARGAASAGWVVQGLHEVFLSTFEKQLDAKRRIVVPQEYRAALSGPFDGVFCLPAIDADCIECGGKALFDRYAALIEELPPGDELRHDLETAIYGGMVRLAFDAAGRITLPEALCDAFGMTDQVAVVGLGDRFQIWPLEAFQARRAAARQGARDGLAALRLRQRQAKAGSAA